MQKLGNMTRIIMMLALSLRIVSCMHRWAFNSKFNWLIVQREIKALTFEVLASRKCESVNLSGH
jgi:hypothetical protein